MQRITIDNLCNPVGADQQSHDPEVEMAAEALGNLRNSNSSLNCPGVDNDLSNSHQPSEHFLNRVSNLPLVNSALRAYESSKANSFVVKYGAETVESSVKSICMPVINKLEPQIGQLDDFACRQLDRLEKHYSSFMDPNTVSQHPEYEIQSSTGSQPFPPPAENNELRNRRVVELSYSEQNPSYNQNNDSQVNKPAPRSRWQQVVLEAGVVAGAGVAVVSEESMKTLRYCQQWLAYASSHIEHQIQILRNYMISLSGPSSSTTVATYNSTATFLNNVKKEVVATLRKVIEVVGRYAGSCLPGDARNSVRNFILNLPGRWASLNVPNLESNNSTPCSSPLLTPNSSSQNSPAVLTPTEQTNRVLTLATESMNMIHNVGDIFKDTVDRAESWLRVVGMTPNQTEFFPENGSLPPFTLLPPPGPRTPTSSGSLSAFCLNQSQNSDSYSMADSHIHREHSSESDCAMN